jgi:hypothetical protein
MPNKLSKLLKLLKRKAKNLNNCKYRKIIMQQINNIKKQNK